MVKRTTLEDRLRLAEAAKLKAEKYLAMVKEGEGAWPGAKKEVARIRTRIWRLKKQIAEKRYD